ncbi:MAG: UDP-glucose 4-epimerase GalE [Oscillospiraceae bacterium]|nr:UDP-glucose 4-epimerase GalE [Oscillospiraceae bacterium]
MTVLVTGGVGYIGSHTIVELTAAGHDVVAIDNLSNAHRGALSRIEKITQCSIPFYQVDIRDREGLNKVFDAHSFDVCIHFAGLKAVGESVLKPWEYYDNNIHGTLTLLDVMRKRGCKSLIFSSSATVYGEPTVIPITERCPKGHCTNPYGKTKSMLEDIMVDLHAADVRSGDPKPWDIVLLRYFNPIGAHPSGLIGEDPNGLPNNLMPYITQVAAGKLEKLHVFGSDYETPDGTGVRDYIHVVDLARGHVKALKAVEKHCGVAVFNLGTGRGCSVLELVREFEKNTGVRIPYVMDERRPGDIAVCYSDPSKAEKELDWKAVYSIADMCRDSWNWQKNNPNGYES